MAICRLGNSGRYCSSYLLDDAHFRGKCRLLHVLCVLFEAKVERIPFAKTIFFHAMFLLSFEQSKTKYKNEIRYLSGNLLKWQKFRFYATA